MRKSWFLLSFFVVFTLVLVFLVFFSKKTFAVPCPYWTCQTNGLCESWNCEYDWCPDCVVPTPTPIPPTPTPIPPTPTPTPTPVPSTNCWTCSDVQYCPDGVTTYKTICCAPGCSGLGCCTAAGAVCYQSQACTSACSTVQDCEARVSQLACATSPPPGCWCANVCGGTPINGVNSSCVAGQCQYGCNWCSAPLPTPTPQTGSGSLMGRIWNDSNCNASTDEIANPSSDPDMIQNPAGVCGAYTNVAASVSYKGPVSGSTIPNQCNPGPYYVAVIPVGSYVASANPPSGWVTTNSPQNAIINKDQATHVWFGLYTCPSFSPPTGLTPSGTLAPGTYTLSWNPVAGATKYALRIDDQINPWTGTCDVVNPGDVCTDVATNSYTYTFQAGHSYSWWVHALSGCGGLGCWGPQASASVVSSTCTVTLSPSSLPFIQGQSNPAPVVPVITITPSGSTTTNRVDYSLSTSGVVTINPTSTSTPSYSTTVTPVYEGSTTLSGKVYLNPGPFLGCECQGSGCTQITVQPPYGWFQTQAGDVHGQGNIQSMIPLTATDLNFSMDSDYTPVYPGVVSYGGGSEPLLGRGVVSSKGWVANSSFPPPFKYTYDQLYKKLDSPTTAFDCGSSSPPNTGFYLANNPVGGECLINKNLDFGTRKVVVFVDGTLKIDSPAQIKVSSGGFLAFIVKGDIKISGQIGSKTTGPFTGTNAHIQGIYIADGTIDTYYDKPAGTGSGFRLVVGGLFYAKNGFNLKRDLKNEAGATIKNSDTPAELFIFRPDLVVNTPKELRISSMSWQEVAP